MSWLFGLNKNDPIPEAPQVSSEYNESEVEGDLLCPGSRAGRA